MVSAWRNFKNIFSRPLFTIIFRPEMLKFHPYSILTVDTMVGFVIFCVLSKIDEILITSPAAQTVKKAMYCRTVYLDWDHIILCTQFTQGFVCWKGSACNQILVFLHLSFESGILLPKLFWPTVRKNCSSDREKLLKFEAEGREFAKILRSLEQFIQTVKMRTIFGNRKIF